jgi:hypothetical protein
MANRITFSQSASIAAKGFLSISKQACRKNAHEQIDRRPVLARSFAVAVIMVTSGDRERLNLAGRFALAVSCGSSAPMTSCL